MGTALNSFAHCFSFREYISEISEYIVNDFAETRLINNFTLEKKLKKKKKFKLITFQKLHVRGVIDYLRATVSA